MSTPFNQKNINVYIGAISRLDAISAELNDLCNVLGLSSQIQEEMEELLLTMRYTTQKKIDEQSTEEEPQSLPAIDRPDTKTTKVELSPLKKIMDLLKMLKMVPRDIDSTAKRAHCAL